MMGWQWHQLDHMQIICTLLQITTPVPHHSVFSFFKGRMPFLPPNQQRQSTEGKIKQNHIILAALRSRCGHYIFAL